jgi:hypothetical protein
MDCPYCGANNRDKAKFCRSCAKRIDGEEAMSGEGDSDGPLVEEGIQARMKKIPKVPIIAGVLMALVVSGWFLMKPRGITESTAELGLSQATAPLAPEKLPIATATPEEKPADASATAAPPPTLDTQLPAATSSAPPPTLDGNTPAAAVTAAPPALDAQAPVAAASAPPPALESKAPNTAGTAAPPALEAKAAGGTAPLQALETKASASGSTPPPALEAKASEAKAPKTSPAKPAETKIVKPKAPKDTATSKQASLPSDLEKIEPVKEVKVAPSNELVEKPVQKAPPARKQKAPELSMPMTLALKPTAVLGALPPSDDVAPMQRTPAKTNMAAEMEACATKSFLAKSLCENQVRAKYCQGKWGVTPECPKQSDSREVGG